MSVAVHCHSRFLSSCHGNTLRKSDEFWCLVPKLLLVPCFIFLTPHLNVIHTQTSLGYMFFGFRLCTSQFTALTGPTYSPPLPSVIHLAGVAFQWTLADAECFSLWCFKVHSGFTGQRLNRRVDCWLRKLEHISLMLVMTFLWCRKKQNPISSSLDLQKHILPCPELNF